MTWSIQLNNPFKRKDNNQRFMTWDELQAKQEAHDKYMFILSCAETFTKRE